MPNKGIPEEIRRSLRELESIDLCSIVKEMLGEEVLEVIAVTQEEALGFISGDYHPQYIIVERAYHEMKNTVQAKIRGFRPEKIQKDKVARLSERLYQIHQELKGRYSSHPDYNVNKSFGEISDRIRYMCVRLDANSQFGSEVYTGSVCNYYEFDELCGNLPIIFSPKHVRLPPETKTLSDYKNEADDAVLVFEGNDALVDAVDIKDKVDAWDTTVKSGLTALDRLGYSIRRAFDGKLVLINLPGHIIIPKGRVVKFIESNVPTSYSGLCKGALMVGQYGK